MSSATKTLINISNKYDRVIILIDMDCFYCQVEEKLNPDLKDKPLAVVQYNTWQGGGIIAVNYAARAEGVTRHMRGNQAKEQCPDIQLVHVPSIREKADLTKYREAGKNVAKVLQKFTSILERASVDEAYLDITKEVDERFSEIDKGQNSIKPDELINTFAVGYHNLGYFINEMSCKYGELNMSQDYDLDEIEHDENDTIDSIRTSNLRLLIGACIASKIRAEVKEVTGYECSAGIAHNKILAKLACGINKPNKQTLLPLKNIVHIFRTLEVKKITGLGGKFGEDVCDKLNVTYIGEVTKFSEKELQKKFDDKNGTWLYLISRGIDLEPVTPRFCSKSIGCCKKFPGRGAITGLNTLKHWLNELSNEICDRLDKDISENNRKAKQLVVGYAQEINSEDISSSRSCNLSNYDPVEIAQLALDVIKRNTAKFLKDGSESYINHPIKFLGLSVSKFESNCPQKSTLKTMFQKQNSRQIQNNNINNSNIESSNKESSSSSETNWSKSTLISKSQDSSLGKFNKNEAKPINNADQQQKEQTDLSNLKKSIDNTEYEKCSLRKLFENQRIRSKDKKNDICNSTSEHAFNEFVLKKSVEIVTINSNLDANVDKENEDLALEILKELEHANVTNQEVLNDVSANENQNTYTSLNNLSLNSRNIKLSNLEIKPSTSENSKQPFPSVTSNQPSTSVTSNQPYTSIPANQPSTSVTSNQPSVSVISNQPSVSVISNQPSTSESYFSKYAEFQTPKPSENDIILCSQCNQKILTYELQTHMDSHLAFQLSQQQREEYRKKRKQFSLTPPNKKHKSSDAKTVDKNRSHQINISQFLLKFNEVPKENQIKCLECHCYIMKDKILEHKDLHVAQKIQREWNFNTIKKKPDKSNVSITKGV